MMNLARPHPLVIQGELETVLQSDRAFRAIKTNPDTRTRRAGAEDNPLLTAQSASVFGPPNRKLA